MIRRNVLYLNEGVVVKNTLFTVSFRYKNMWAQVNFTIIGFVLWRRTNLFYDFVFLEFSEKNNKFISLMVRYFRRSLSNQLCFWFRMYSEGSCKLSDIVFVSGITFFVYNQKVTNSTIFRACKNRELKLNFF